MTCLGTGQADERKRQLVQQLAHLDASYNGGLAAYITNAKHLLQDSRAGATHGARPAPHTDCFICIPKYNPTHCTYSASTGKNPFEGYIPEVPDGERMDFGSEKFVENELQGAQSWLTYWQPHLTVPAKSCMQSQGLCLHVSRHAVTTTMWSLLQQLAICLRECILDCFCKLP